VTVCGKVRAKTNSCLPFRTAFCKETPSKFHMIRELKSGEYRLYSLKKNPKTAKRRNLGTFSSMEKAKEHERAVQYFKRH
jgi:hypothetical protein